MDGNEMDVTIHGDDWVIEKNIKYTVIEHLEKVKNIS